MCGIAGIYHFDKGSHVEKSILQCMTDVIEYRGPDDEGFYTDHHVGLGFRRLSIVGLNNGHQPMATPDNQLNLICNGEIYNYRELRNELESKGHTFRTDSDVEVLLYLYREHGSDFFNKLNGQFAFAIYDKTENRLLLARDHVGIAPLFYTIVNRKIIFASEIKVLLQHPEVTPELNLEGLDQIITFPGPISPTTVFKNISSLKPGERIIVQGENVHKSIYWDLDYPTEPIVSNRCENDYVDELEELLKNSVKYRLNADVPVGFYLSGGMDSSLIAALMHKEKSSQQRRSFSIEFGDATIDESSFQKIMVDQVQSLHKHTRFDWNDISSRLKRAIFHAECPLRETYNTCSLELSKLVHENNIKVVLTGEGADEIFGGYVGYRLDMEREQNPEDDPFSLEAMLENETRELMWGDENLFYEKSYSEFRETKAALYSDDIAAQLTDFDCTQRAVVDHDKLRGRHRLHQRSYLDFKLRMSDHLLADHGDRVALANSVEARYPFLDIGILEFARRLPPELMVKNGEEKYILRKLAQRYLPDEIIHRKKFAFVAPGSPALIRQDIEWINDMLSYDSIKQAGIFNPDTVEHLKNLSKQPNFSLNPTFEVDLLLIVLTCNILRETFRIEG